MLLFKKSIYSEENIGLFCGVHSIGFTVIYENVGNVGRCRIILHFLEGNKQSVIPD